MCQAVVLCYIASCVLNLRDWPGCPAVSPGENDLLVPRLRSEALASLPGVLVQTRLLSFYFICTCPVAIGHNLVSHGMPEQKQIVHTSLPKNKLPCISPVSRMKMTQDFRWV